MRNSVKENDSNLLLGTAEMLDEVDLFNAGLDSLQTSELTGQLKAWISTNEEAAKTTTITMKPFTSIPQFEILLRILINFSLMAART